MINKVIFLLLINKVIHSCLNNKICNNYLSIIAKDVNYVNTIVLSVSNQ